MKQDRTPGQDDINSDELYSDFLSGETPDFINDSIEDIQSWLDQLSPFLKDEKRDSILEKIKALRQEKRDNRED